MKIALNAILWNYNRKTDGIGRYIGSLLKEFENYKEHEFYVFVDRLYKYKGLKNSYRSKNVKPVLIPLPTFFLFLRKIWTFLLWPLFSAVLRIEVCFAPDGFLPVWGFKKYIVTIHDLAFLRFPGNVSDKALKMLNKYYERSVFRSDMVVTVSQCSKKDILDTYKIPETKVEAIYNGAADIFFDDLSGSDLKKLGLKYDTSVPYLFYYGTVEPRKNLISIIKAFNLVKESHENLKLFIAGKEGWLNEQLHETYEASKWKKDIQFLGPVSDPEIIFLLKNSLAFIYIPLYEGFGLPVVEAMACGANVITSNVSSIPEIIGDCGTALQPENISEIADSIAKLIGRKREENRKAIERAGNFRWKNSAEKHIQVINNLVI